MLAYRRALVILAAAKEAGGRIIAVSNVPPMPENALLRCLRIATLTAISGATLAGCGSGSRAVPAAAIAEQARPNAATFKTPALLTFDYAAATIDYWRIKKGGSSRLEPITGRLDIRYVVTLAANGRLVIMGNIYPISEIVTYDLATGAEKKFDLPNGEPRDVAVDTAGIIYAAHSAGVAVYRGSPSTAQFLTCSLVSPQAIALDREGDIYAGGNYGNDNRVVVFRRGSTVCRQVKRLRPLAYYFGGVGVDPKTDDLIVVDDATCQPGSHPHMTIYPKPYQRSTSKRIELRGARCPGQFRLDAHSAHIFVTDYELSDSYGQIREFAYPSGAAEGVYRNPRYSSGLNEGVTTIPNTLPN